MSVRLQEMTASLAAAQTSSEMRGCVFTLSVCVFAATTASLSLSMCVCACALACFLCVRLHDVTRLCNLMKSVLF